MRYIIIIDLKIMLESVIGRNCLQSVYMEFHICCYLFFFSNIKAYLKL